MCTQHNNSIKSVDSIQIIEKYYNKQWIEILKLDNCIKDYYSKKSDRTENLILDKTFTLNSFKNMSSCEKII